MAAASETQENSEDANSVNDTGSEVSCNDNSKMKLKDLKVVDLRKELEKRELDKNGVKVELIERLKEAIVKEGEDPEEYDFEVHDHKNNSEKNIVDTIDAGEITCDKANEDKIEEALQLSIDEEEAQLNEEEGLIDIPKETSSDKIEDVASADNGPSTEINLVPNQNQTEESSTTIVAKTSNDDTKPKKVGKSPSQNKSTENLNSSSPKAVKVIGKNEKSKGTTATSAKCLWVTGIPDNTRAADLKALFSKQGRVLAVKIVKNAKQTPSRCYGYVTMSTSKDASKAIQNLHRTELNGRVISVERAQNEPSTLLKKAESKLLTASSKKTTVKKEVTTPKKTAPVQNETNSESKSKEKPKEETKTPASAKASPQETGKKKEEKVSSSEKEKLKDKERKFRDHRQRDIRRPIRRPPPPIRKPRSFGYNERPYGSFGRQVGRKPFTNRIGFGSGFKPRPNLAALQKIREERYQRERFRERRELESRRLDEISRHRYIERKQREEAYRLEREKEKLRIERELLERERAEILKLEREKQRLERERLEREREELRRQAELRRSTKRPYSQVSRETDLLWEERKKSSRYEGSASFHRESSSSSRFEYPPRERASYSREYDRHPERFSSRKHVETLPPTEFNDRDARREVTIRTRDERHVFGRSDFKDRDRSFSSRERHSSSRREPPRDDWKHDRRVHERIISSSSSGGHRRMDFY